MQIIRLVAAVRVFVSGFFGYSPGKYRMPATVVELSDLTDTVVFEDDAGNLWAIYGTEDWFLGDRAVLYMDGAGTSAVCDDAVLRAVYVG